MKKIFTVSIALLVVALTSFLTYFLTITFYNFWPPYWDDRTAAQIKDHTYIEENISDDNLSKDKKVLIYAIDGIEFDNLNEYIINDNEDIKFKQEFTIQNFESVYGWASVLYGNILMKNKTIFEMLKGKELKTGMVSAWTQWNNKIIFDRETKGADDWIDISMTDPTFEELDSSATLEQVKEKINFTNSKVGDLLKNETNYSLFLHYDTIADNLGHAGFDYETEQVKTAFDLYKDRANYYFGDKFANDNTLVIGVTDHGRNPDGKQHNQEQVHNRKSWVISNQDLNKYTGVSENRNFQNFYDIKNVIYNFLKA